MFLTLGVDGTPLGHEKEEMQEEEISMITILHHQGSPGSDHGRKVSDHSSHVSDHSSQVSDVGSQVSNEGGQVYDKGSQFSGIAAPALVPLDPCAGSGLAQGTGLSPSTEPVGGGATVVVGVTCVDSASKDAISWAVANKIQGPQDTLVLLHVVSRVPSPGQEQFQSGVPQSLFNQFLGDVVQPMLEELKASLHAAVVVCLCVGRHNSRAQGILEEDKRLRASDLVLGTRSKGLLLMMSKVSTVGKHCASNRPSGMSVYIVRKDKVLLAEETHSPSCITPRHTISPDLTGINSCTFQSAPSPYFSSNASPMQSTTPSSVDVASLDEIPIDWQSAGTPPTKQGPLPATSRKQSAHAFNDELLKRELQQLQAKMAEDEVARLQAELHAQQLLGELEVHKAEVALREAERAREALSGLQCA